MAAPCLTQVPVPAPGTGGCQCPMAPDPCGTGKCVHWSDRTTCGPPVVDCDGCSSCEWIRLAGAPQCSGTGSGAVVPVVGVIALLGFGVVAVRASHHRDEYHARGIAHGQPGHSHGAFG